MGDVLLFSKVLLSALPLFGLVAIGYLSKRFRILHVTDTDVLNRFVMDIALPAFIFDALVHNKVRAAYLTLPVVIWVSEIAVLLIGLAVAKLLKFGPKQTGTILLVSTFANTGYLGYPMTTALFPALLPATVIMDQMGMSMFLYPSAAMLGSVYGRSTGKSFWQSLSRSLRSPIFLAMLVGLAFRFMPWPGPPAGHKAAIAYYMAVAIVQALGKSLHVVAQATVPVILISIGIILRPSTLTQHMGAVSVIAVLRLLVAPFVGFLVARYLIGIHDDPTLISVCVLECALPPSANATMFSGQYDMDGSLGAAAFFALTILSAVTIPLVLSVLR